MEREKIERLLIEWSNVMVKKFDGLIIRYEYSVSFHTYLVSYNRLSIKEQANQFYGCLIKFEKRLDDEFPVGAPLFSEGNRLFKLTDKAKVVKG